MTNKIPADLLEAARAAVKSVKAHMICLNGSISMIHSAQAFTIQNSTLPLMRAMLRELSYYSESYSMLDMTGKNRMQECAAAIIRVANDVCGSEEQRP